MVPIQLPRYVSFKRLANGDTAFYWTCPSRYRALKCPYLSAALGSNLSAKEVASAASIWNDRLDEWRNDRLKPSPRGMPNRYGTVEWLTHVYQRHDLFLERVGEFSRPDYRRVFDRVADCEIASPKKAEKLQSEASQ